MAWCEANGVDYVLRLQKTERLKARIQKEMSRAKKQHDRTGQPARVFKDFQHSTLDSWSRQRRVTGKAEYLSKGENPRFIVTSFSKAQYESSTLYGT